MIVVSRQAESVLSGIADRKNPPSRRAAAQELLRLGPFVCHRRRRNAENKQSEQAGYPTRWNDTWRLCGDHSYCWVVYISFVALMPSVDGLDLDLTRSLDRLCLAPPRHIPVALPRRERLERVQPDLLTWCGVGMQRLRNQAACLEGQATRLGDLVVVPVPHLTKLEFQLLVP